MRSLKCAVLFLFLVLSLLLPLAAFAAETAHAMEGTQETSVGEGVKRMGYGLGAGLAVGLAGIATGLAQSRIGAAGIGALAENPKLIGNVILLVALPETVVILGFVIAFMILGAA